MSVQMYKTSELEPDSLETKFRPCKVSSGLAEETMNEQFSNMERPYISGLQNGTNTFVNSS